jgi:RNA polymerase sigma-70 factor (ECF subfamily)
MPAAEPLPTAPALAAEIERLYREHHAMILRTAYRITRDMKDAEDVLHGLFVRILQREGPAAPEAHAGPYLHRAAVNLSLDLLRRRARNQPLDRLGPVVPDGQPGPDEESRRVELANRLRAAIARLSPRAAEVFVLRHVEGLSNREVARMLGTSWSVVAVTLHRARRRLREELQS